MSRNVLIVDDSAVMRKIVMRALRQASVQVDQVFEASPLRERIPLQGRDKLIWVSVEQEPTTRMVDHYRDEILAHADALPDAVIGIGGGSVMDYAKAIERFGPPPGKFKHLKLKRCRFAAITFDSRPGFLMILKPGPKKDTWRVTAVTD